MLLSATVRYALRAVVYLARSTEAGSGPVPMQKIAAATGIPSNYLSKLLHQLARAGILASTRGPAGGFAFAMSPRELTLAQVSDTFMPSAPGVTLCLLSDHACDPNHPCVAHERWAGMAEDFQRFFHETTIEGLLVSQASERRFAEITSDPTRTGS